MSISKRILVTGGGSGIGAAIAESLTNQGHRVVISVRDADKGCAATAKLNEACAEPMAEYVIADLSSISAVRDMADEVRERFPDLSVLVNNAGVWMSELVITEDGLEQSFMVNHLAPYLLARELFPLLNSNAPSRIVNVNAGLYMKGDLSLELTPYGKDFGPIKSYATSKLCNVLCTLDLAAEWQNSGTTVNAVHPGVINTALGDSPRLLSRMVKLVKRFWQSPEQGAKAPVWLAIGEEAQGLNGKYYDEMTLHDVDAKARDVTLQKALRALSDSIIANSSGSTQP